MVFLCSKKHFHPIFHFRLAEFLRISLFQPNCNFNLDKLSIFRFFQPNKNIFWLKSVFLSISAKITNHLNIFIYTSVQQVSFRPRIFATFAFRFASCSCRYSSNKNIRLLLCKHKKANAFYLTRICEQKELPLGSSGSRPVSRVMSVPTGTRMIIYLVRLLPAASSDLPEEWAGSP